MPSLNLLKHPQGLLTSASRAEQRLTRVLTSTVQPNTVEMCSIDKFIYIVYAASQVAYDDPLIGTLGRRERYSASWCDSHTIWKTDTGPWCDSHTTSINRVELSLPSSLLGQLGCSLILTCLSCRSKACDRSARISVPPSLVAREYRNLIWGGMAWSYSAFGTENKDIDVRHDHRP